jgi:hypothetical protein
MKKILTYVLLPALCVLSPRAQGQSISSNKLFTIGTNNVLRPGETNFFVVNSNLLNQAVAPAGGGGSSSVYSANFDTNGASQVDLAPEIQPTNILAKGWLQVNGNQTNAGTLTVNGASTFIGPNSGYSANFTNNSSQTQIGFEAHAGASIAQRFSFGGSLDWTFGATSSAFQLSDNQTAQAVLSFATPSDAATFIGAVSIPSWLTVDGDQTNQGTISAENFISTNGPIWVGSAARYAVSEGVPAYAGWTAAAAANTTGFSNASYDASISNTVVYVPGGTYVLNPFTNLASLMYGDGPCAHLIFNTNQTGATLLTMSSNGANGCSLRGVWVDGYSVGLSGSYPTNGTNPRNGVQACALGQSTIENVLISDMQGVGLIIAGDPSDKGSRDGSLLVHNVRCLTNYIGVTMPETSGAAGSMAEYATFEGVWACKNNTGFYGETPNLLMTGIHADDNSISFYFYGDDTGRSHGTLAVFTGNHAGSQTLFGTNLNTGLQVFDGNFQEGAQQVEFWDSQGINFGNVNFQDGSLLNYYENGLNFYHDLMDPSDTGFSLLSYSAGSIYQGLYQSNGLVTGASSGSYIPGNVGENTNQVWNMGSGTLSQLTYALASFTTTGWTNTNKFNVDYLFPAGVTNLNQSNSVPTQIFTGLTAPSPFTWTMQPGDKFTNASASVIIKAH